MIKNSKVTAKAVTKLRLLFLENKGKLPKNITDEKVIRYFNLINKLIKKYNLNFSSVRINGIKVCRCGKIHSNKTGCSYRCGVLNQTKYEKYLTYQKRYKTEIERYGSRENRYKQSIAKTIETFNKKYGCNSFSATKNWNTYLKDKIIEKYGSYKEYEKQRNKKFSESLIKKYGSKLNYYMSKYSDLFSNKKDINKEFIIKNFLNEDNLIEVKKMSNYFGCSDGNAKVLLKLLDIEYDYKRYDSFPQQLLFESINLENKIYNDRTLIKPLEIDILLPDLKLGIEYNGLVFHTYGKKLCKSMNGKINSVYETKEYKKYLLMKEKGFSLMSILETDNIDFYKNIINNNLKLNKPVIINKIKPIDTDFDFIKLYYYKIIKPKKIIGYYSNDELIAVKSGLDVIIKFGYDYNSVLKYVKNFRIPNHFGLELNFKLKNETPPKLVKLNKFYYIDFGSKIYKGIFNEKF